MNLFMQSAINVLGSARLRPSRSQALRFGISFALAVLMWGWVTELQDPVESREIVNVPIAVGQLPESLQIVSSLPDVTVTFSGPESRIAPIRAPDITVEADTSGISQPGTYLVPLLVEVENVNEQSVEPEDVTIQVDSRVSEIFPLEVTHTDLVDQTREVGAIEPVVSQVTVTGPTTAVERIVVVNLPVTIEGQTQSYDAAYIPLAVDDSGQRVTEVDILPESIMTHVEVQTRGKALSVVPVITGVPADSHSVQQRQVLPDTIVVDGPEEVLGDLLFVNTDPVDVTDSTQSISTRVGLADLPDGVTILEPAGGTVEVRVAIEDITASSQTLNGLPVESVGLEDGLTASFDPESVSIQVSAPAEILQSMTPDGIGVFVDVSELGPGTHKLALEVTVPQGATWIGGDFAEIFVTIEESVVSSSDQATPTASPVP
jgi:YbbR domain-containing protein